MRVDVLLVLDDLLEILARAAQELGASGRWSAPHQTIEHVRDHTRRVRTGDLSRLDDLRELFKVGSGLQEMAITSGWALQFVQLAARFDHAVRDPGEAVPVENPLLVSEALVLWARRVIWKASSV